MYLHDWIRFYAHGLIWGAYAFLGGTVDIRQYKSIGIVSSHQLLTEALTQEEKRMVMCYLAGYALFSFGFSMGLLGFIAIYIGLKAAGFILVALYAIFPPDLIFNDGFDNIGNRILCEKHSKHCHKCGQLLRIEQNIVSGDSLYEVRPVHEWERLYHANCL